MNTYYNSQYSKGKLYCKYCQKYYFITDCPIYQSKIQKWPVCPKCPYKYKLRVSTHNKNYRKKNDPIWLASRKF